MHPLILAIYRVFGLPVPFQSMFGDDPGAPSCYMITVEGDSTMLPTTKVGTFGKFLDSLRDLHRAASREQKWIVLDLGNAWVWKPEAYVRVVYCDVKRLYTQAERTTRTSVHPQRIHTRFIAVKRGREHCSFGLVGADGYARWCAVVARGGYDEVTTAVQARRLQELRVTMCDQQALIAMAKEYMSDQLITFV